MIFGLSGGGDTVVVEVEVGVFAASEEDAGVELMGVGEGKSLSCRS